MPGSTAPSRSNGRDCTALRHLPCRFVTFPHFPVGLSANLKRITKRTRCAACPFFFLHKRIRLDTTVQRSPSWGGNGSGGLPPARGPGAAEAPGCRNGTKIVWKRGWVLGVPNLDKRRLIRYTNLVKASGESECQTLSRIPEFFRLVRREPVSPSPKKKNMSGLPGTFGTWPEP